MPEFVLPPCNDISGIGSLQKGLVRLIVGDMVTFRTAWSIVSSGGPDHNLATMLQGQGVRLPKIPSLDLEAHQIKDPYGMLGDRTRAINRQGALAVPNQLSNDRHITAVRAAGIDSPFSFWIYSWGGAHEKQGEDMLVDRHRRLPWEVTFGCTVVPHEQYIRDKLADNPDFPLSLKARGLTECTLLFSNLSKVAERFGRPFQLELIAKAAAGMMSGIWHFPNQKSPADMAHALGSYGGNVGISSGVRHLTPVETRWYKSIRQLFGWLPKGSANFEDLKIQVLNAAEDAINDPAWRSIDEKPSRDKQAFLILTVPLQLADRALWRRLVKDLAR